MIKTKVAIVDDHAILRQGLIALLTEMDGMEVVIEAANGKEFVDRLALVSPDLLIVDINMPIMDGEQAVKIAKQKLPGLKVIVLTMNNEEAYFKTMNQLGVDGYIIKESDYDELERAVSTVMKGGKYFSQALLLMMVNSKHSTPNVVFTEKEQEILQFMCQGLSAAEIADKVFMSVRTVEKYRSDMLTKTESPNSISLAIYAIKNGIVKI
jgi:DNA-binding NarL/FixJ family response regulator